MCIEIISLPLDFLIPLICIGCWPFIFSFVSYLLPFFINLPSHFPPLCLLLVPYLQLFLSLLSGKNGIYLRKHMV